jgi:hypothetical protein
VVDAVDLVDEVVEHRLGEVGVRRQEPVLASLLGQPLVGIADRLAVAGEQRQDERPAAVPQPGLGDHLSVPASLVRSRR